MTKRKQGWCLPPGIATAILATVGCGDIHREDVSSIASPLNAADPVASAAPKDQIPFVFHTLANAECALHWANPASGSATAKVYSDDEGVVRFSLGGGIRGVSPLSDLPDSLLLDCRDDEGRIDNCVVDPRDPEPATHVSPAPAPPAVIRPALAGDPMAPSLEELVQQGFPPRPDRTQDSAGYSSWLDYVSRPARVVSPRLVPRPDRHATTINNNNIWSGLAVKKPATTYGYVTGNWNVPYVYDPDTWWDGSHYWYPANLGNRYEVQWVGLDGFSSSNDVVQDGIENAVYAIMAGDQYWIYVTSYYAWIEWFPADQVMISNFSVAVGDLIYATAWVGNNSPCGAMDVTANHACFTISRNRNGTVTQVSTSTNKPAATTFVGDSAEMILERPTVGGALYGLPYYGSAYMMGFVALSTGLPPVHNFGNDPVVQFNMYNGATLLSDASQVDSQRLLLHWDATQ